MPDLRTQSGRPTAAAAAEPFDPFTDEFIIDPWADLDEMRRQGPVSYLPRYDAWAVAHHRHVVEVLRDPSTFSSASGTGFVNVKRSKPWRRPSVILDADRPEHTAPRRVLSQVLSEGAVRDLRGHLQVHADRIVSEVLDRGEFDAVAELAGRYPVEAFGSAVGLLDLDGTKLLSYGAMSFDGNGPPNDRFLYAVRDPDGIAAWVDLQCRREALSPTGLGARVYQAADRGAIDHEQAGLLVRSLLSAGLDTTVSALGFLILHFARDQRLWAAVRQDPQRIHNIFDEVVRLEAPFLMFFRTTTRNVALDGSEIPADSKVLVMIGGACRDPAQWERPDVLDPDRDTRAHTGFGAGIHQCVGRSLARLEGECLVEALAKRVKSWELSGNPILAARNTMRTVAALPVRIGVEGPG